MINAKAIPISLINVRNNISKVKAQHTGISENEKENVITSECFKGTKKQTYLGRNKEELH